MLELVEGGHSKARFWQNHIEGWERSGVSQRDYCSSRNLALSTFCLWRRRLAGDAGDSRQEAGAVQIVPVSQVTLQGAAAVTVVVGHYRIEIGVGARVETLRVVLEALEQA